MKKLKRIIFVFFILLCIPLAYLVLRTYQGLAQEEIATLRFFTESMFDDMEQALADIVIREEGRGVDEYNYTTSAGGITRQTAPVGRTGLSQSPMENFIIGYFQNHPDGSFQTPLVRDLKQVPAVHRQVVAQLEHANTVFNRKRVTTTDHIPAVSLKTMRPVEAEMAEERQTKGFADKYIDYTAAKKARSYLGQKEKRVENITVSQALNITGKDTVQETRPRTPAPDEGATPSGGWLRRSAPTPPAAENKLESRQDRQAVALEMADAAPADLAASGDQEAGSFQVEVAPLQSVFLDDERIYIFRRIMIDGRIYRQGFILAIRQFLDHLSRTHFMSQPMAGFSRLRLKVVDQGRITGQVGAGATVGPAAFALERTFPAPFAFLNAVLTCDKIPAAGGRRTLNIMIMALTGVFLIGLFAIYHSVRTIVDSSERRSQFVSSVTHELKTPLTNIRMYIEMLEQGVARDHEREQEYFRILDSEGSRLSRLINNVLELSKLEKKQRHVNPTTGTFEDVIEEVEAVMQEKLRQEKFALSVDRGPIRPFQYDREMMIQVLINLIDNSVKFSKAFGREDDPRQITIRIGQESEATNIQVSDTGPGIPRNALKKVFDDFYRVENALTRTTRGTGIGLSLVKKFITLMGGTVTAANNDGPGCTITISLP